MSYDSALQTEEWSILMKSTGLPETFGRLNLKDGPAQVNEKELRFIVEFSWSKFFGTYIYRELSFYQSIGWKKLQSKRSKKTVMRWGRVRQR